MTVNEAKVVLGRALDFKGNLDCLNPIIFWRPSQERITLEGRFTIMQLRAMIVLMEEVK